MRNSTRFWLVACVVLLAGEVRAAEPNVDFARDVQPILTKNCGKCHGVEKQQGGLRFDAREGLVRKGDSGNTAVSPGKSAKSELIRRLETADADERMPPEMPPLGAEQIKILRAWIDQGATMPAAGAAAGRKELVVTPEDRQHWSYRPLKKVELPVVKDQKWPATEIDRFVQAAFEAKGISANGPASRTKLIRRVYFDLIGLPPTPEEVAAFVEDKSDQAYEALVNRLLASRHYGERWGRHWLDVASYADSDGLETDTDRPTAYHYRDFVIRALNDDLSYQTFVRWQLAGDEYEPGNREAIAATGFLTAAPYQPLNVPMEEEKLRLRYNEMDDMAATTASGFLGLTLGCARCHDHKFDAIPTRDYYRMQAAFTTTARGNVPLAPPEEIEKHRQATDKWNEEVKAAQSRHNDWLNGEKKGHEVALRTAKIDALSVSDDEKRLLKEKPDADEAKELAKKHEKALRVEDGDFRRVFNDEQRRKWDELKGEVDAARNQKPQALPTALAISDTKSEPAGAWLLARGDFYSKTEPLQLGFLTVLTGSKAPQAYWAQAKQEAAQAKSTRQRRALADWITDTEQGAGALLARVMINRVWQHHFGEGLVRTVSDFGIRGERPTHPELLEWLAHDFVANGWKLKRLHRLIMTSAVYRQDTTFDAERAQVDADNRLLWRRRPLRLEAEVLRDAVLATSGTLNLEAYGPAFKAPIPAEAIVARNTKDPYPNNIQDTPATRRRTVYMFHKRVVQHPLLQTFDGPDAAVTCGRRNNTTVAPQALALLNDVFIRDRAMDFAKRLSASGGDTFEKCIKAGFRQALGREPGESEAAAALKFVNAQVERRQARDPQQPAGEVRLLALADLCQALYGLNEFVYVD